MKKTFLKNHSDNKITTDPSINYFFTAKSLAVSFITEYQHNEFIQKEEQAIHYLYFILSGKAKIITNHANGKRLIVQFLGQEDFIGDLTIIGAEDRTKDVISIGKTRCLAVPIAHVESDLLKNNDFLRKISCYIGRKLLARTAHFATSQTYELKYRLADLILLVAEKELYQENQAQIAEYLGVSYRHLLHTLKLFREEGLLEKVAVGDRINREKLEELVRTAKNK